MKFLLICLVVITTTSALQQNNVLLDKIPVIARSVAAHIHQTSNRALATSSRQTQGLNFDDCSVGQCAGARVCVAFNSEESTCPPGSSCQCLPTSSASCNTSADCDEGESCASNSSSGNASICFSDTFIAGTDMLSVVEEDVVSTPDVETPTPEPGMSAGQGLSFDSCTIEQGCAPGLVCLHDDGTNFEPCVLGKPCICLRDPLATLFCTSSDECDAGESCATAKIGFSEDALCISNAALAGSDDFIIVEDIENQTGMSPKGKKMRLTRRERRILKKKRRMRRKKRRMRRKKRRTAQKKRRMRRKERRMDEKKHPMSRRKRRTGKKKNEDYRTMKMTIRFGKMMQER